MKTVIIDEIEYACPTRALIDRGRIMGFFPPDDDGCDSWLDCGPATRQLLALLVAAGVPVASCLPRESAPPEVS